MWSKRLTLRLPTTLRHLLNKAMSEGVKRAWRLYACAYAIVSTIGTSRSISSSENSFSFFAYLTLNNCLPPNASYRRPFILLSNIAKFPQFRFSSINEFQRDNFCFHPFFGG